MAQDDAASLAPGLSMRPSEAVDFLGGGEVENHGIPSKVHVFTSTFVAIAKDLVYDVFVEVS